MPFNFVDHCDQLGETDGSHTRGFAVFQADLSSGGASGTAGDLLSRFTACPPKH